MGDLQEFAAVAWEKLGDLEEASMAVNHLVIKNTGKGSKQFPQPIGLAW